MHYIDAHQHYWNPARGDYGWMPVDNPILSRPYTPADLATAAQATNVKQTVLVQAAPTIEETEYLLGIADASPSVAKVVGWINFEDASQVESLKRLAAHPKFSGVRPMIQDLPDKDWMLREDVQWAYQALIDFDLTFDCLGFPSHLQNFHRLLKQYPDLRAVIDHCMKPQLRTHSDEQFSIWAEGMARIAEDTGAYCKLSGLVTEADTDCSLEELKPYTDHVISVFGAERVMWGSDWPVVRLRVEYEDWFTLATALTAELTQTQRDLIFAGTAKKFYRI